jgi:hydroperoxide dehydratase
VLWHVSVKYTGGYRVLPYLDPSEERHTKLKTFCFELIKDNGRELFFEFRYETNDKFM